MPCPTAILLLTAALIVAWHKPTPTAEEIDQQHSQHAAELREAELLADRFTQELLGF